MWQVIKTIVAAIGFADKSGFAPANFPLPAFCNNLDCPVYTVLESHQGYEFRQYQPSRWVSASAYRKLFEYIWDANMRDEKLDMTVPVIRYYQTSPVYMKNISFFLPFVNQDDPPKPTSKDVYNEDWPLMKVYVRSFGGYANSGEVRLHLDHLKADIGNASKYHNSFYYTAGYDSPIKFLCRHNEVWLLATN